MTEKPEREHSPRRQDSHGLFGGLGRIGVVAPSTCERAAKEFYEVVPPGVGLLIATLTISRINQDHVNSALDRVDDAVRHLVDTGADDIYVAGLPLVLPGGEPFDAALRQRVESDTGLKNVGTDLSVVLEAIRHLDLTDLLVVTPFREEVTESIVDALRRADVTVLAHASMGYERQNQYGLLPDAAPRDAVRELRKAHPRAKGIYVPCGRIGNVLDVSEWEQEFGIPVLTANQLFIWWALKRTGLGPAVGGCGELLTSMRPQHLAGAL